MYGICENRELLGIRLRTNRSLSDVSMSVSIVTTAAAAWDWIPGLSCSFVESNVDDVWKPFAHSSSLHRSTSFNKTERMLKQMVKPFARALK